jgi:predicted component of type VI protein secretion system
MAVNNHYLPVNWADGMKVNKDHFIATDRNTIQAIRNSQSRFLNPYNYGLALPVSDRDLSLKLSIELDNQGSLHIKILRCQAVTRDGTTIDIDRNYFTEDELTATLPSLKFDPQAGNENSFYILLAINPFGRQTTGLADPEETPPRLPYVIPEYQLTIQPASQKSSINSESALILGKIVNVDRKPEMDETYIPPCQTVFSHPKLAEYFSWFMKIFGQLEIDLADILQSINEKKQSTTIAGSVAEMSHALLWHVGSVHSSCRKSLRYEAPVLLFEHISSIARLIQNSINTPSRADREELLNYINDWSNLRQGEFEELIRQSVDLEYDHEDINQVMQKTDPFLRSISKVFNTLSNLEFIGKKKDRQIFVKEQVEKPGKSFLVD